MASSSVEQGRAADVVPNGGHRRAVIESGAISQRWRNMAERTSSIFGSEGMSATLADRGGLEVQPVGGHIGADIRGVDFSQPLSDDVVASDQSGLAAVEHGLLPRSAHQAGSARCLRRLLRYSVSRAPHVDAGASSSVSKGSGDRCSTGREELGPTSSTPATCTRAADSSQRTSNGRHRVRTRRATRTALLTAVPNFKRQIRHCHLRRAGRPARSASGTHRGPLPAQTCEIAASGPRGAVPIRAWARRGRSDLLVPRVLGRHGLSCNRSERFRAGRHSRDAHRRHLSSAGSAGRVYNADPREPESRCSPTAWIDARPFVVKVTPARGRPAATDSER